MAEAQPYLHRYKTRHGKIIWYVRKGRGQRIRIRGEPGSAEFLAAYKAALSGESVKGLPLGTLAWAIHAYMRSLHWSRLSPATRKQRDCIYETLRQDAGGWYLDEINKAQIEDALKRREGKPSAQRHFVQSMRALFEWAIGAGHARHNPTLGVKAATATGEGHLPWRDADIARFARRWPMGTREFLMLSVLIETGLRRGDAATVGWQHVKDGIIRIETEKTGELVTIPITRRLGDALMQCPQGDTTWIAGMAGRPLTKESFGNYFRDACRAAGLKKSAHGLRKTAAERAAEDGFTEAELEARFGWRGGRMASHYTRKANRERLAIESAKKLTERA